MIKLCNPCAVCVLTVSRILTFAKVLASNQALPYLKLRRRKPNLLRLSLCRSKFRKKQISEKIVQVNIISQWNFSKLTGLEASHNLGSTV